MNGHIVTPFRRRPGLFRLPQPITRHASSGWGVAPLELHRQRQADPALAAQDIAAPLADLEDLWCESAGPDILAVLPELAGPEGYLAWAYEGLTAARERLASAVPGVPSVLDTAAHLVMQAGLEHVLAGLASAAGTDGYLAVQERIAAAGDFDARAWRKRTRGWLSRGLAAGQIEACRAWLDMAVRLTGILQGLPGYPARPDPCHVPVGGFQYDVRALARPRRTPTRWSPPWPWYPAAPRLPQPGLVAGQMMARLSGLRTAARR
jgi:hypothetical protein